MFSAAKVIRCYTSTQMTLLSPYTVYCVVFSLSLSSPHGEKSFLAGVNNVFHGQQCALQQRAGSRAPLANSGGRAAAEPRPSSTET